jgi:DNA-binding transcriptional regulator YiaG
MSVAEQACPAEVVAISIVRRAASDGVTRRVRELAKVSLEEMARSVGVSAQSVLRWELGRRSPRTGAAVRYTHAIELLLATIDDSDPAIRQLRNALEASHRDDSSSNARRRPA